MLERIKDSEGAKVQWAGEKGVSAKKRMRKVRREEEIGPASGWVSGRGVDIERPALRWGGGTAGVGGAGGTTWTLGLRMF